MKFKIALLATFYMLINTAYTQETPTQIIDSFFATFDKDPMAGIDFIFSKNEIFLEKEKEQVDHVKERLESSLEFLGDYHGHEFIVKKNVADCYELHSYLVKFSTQPVRFKFKFYKPEKQWIIMSFSFDDDIAHELDEAAKIYYPQNH